MRAAIWRNTLLAATIYGIAIAAADRLLQPLLPTGRAMTLAISFSAVQVVAILVMVTALFARKQWNVVRLAQSRRVGPLIQEALALHAVGIDQRGRLEQLHRRAPDDVRETFFMMLASTRGESRQRVAMLASDLGLTERRSQDSVDWIRNLIRLRQAAAFAEIVTGAAHQNLLVRAVASEELASYAADISEEELSAVLQSGEVEVVITALEMMRAWRRARRVPGFTSLLTHDDPRVRSRALLALPFAAADARPESLAPAIVAALDAEHAEVRAAAAHAAGRLGVTGAVPALSARLADEHREIALAAAFALASLGEPGHSALQKLILGTDRNAASVAFEATEKSAMGLTEL